MESLYTYTIFFVLLGVVALPYWIRAAKQRRESEEALRKQKSGTALLPVTLHPQIDIDACIGCGSCVKVCPEGVLGLVDGHAAIAFGLKCVGHALCAEVCPVGAITMGFGIPRQGEEIPWYDDHFQTNIPGLFIVGELGGIGLVKNAVSQATTALTSIGKVGRNVPSNDLDIVIVGAGPAGLTAALAAQEQRVRYIVLEQESIGGSILHYPRQKLVLTSSVRLPLHGKLDFHEVSKEDLLSFWLATVKRYGLRIESNKKVTAIERTESGFLVRAGDAGWTATNVVLALGRRGSPRKLGVRGEELPKVTYKLIEAESYQHQHLLVVGGGNSAVEAAVALGRQRGNTVTLSYRQSQFVRLKEKNEKTIGEMIRSKKIQAAFGTTVEQIESDSVVLRDGLNAAVRLRNDAVLVFAGGELPAQLLRSVGVRMRGSEAAISGS